MFEVRLHKEVMDVSFSSRVKKELTSVLTNARHCMIAEISALVLMCAEITNKNDIFDIKFNTENPATARKYFTIIKKAFNMNVEVLAKDSKKFNKKRSYLLRIPDQKMSKKVLLATTILKNEEGKLRLKDYVDNTVIQSMCCKRAYLRGAFLAAGSVSDPQKGYHLEFVCQTNNNANHLKQILNGLDMEAKIVMRKNSYVVYLKEGTQIVDLLNVMGAHNALMELENIRIVKEVRNNVNRIVNCETANLKKTVSAAVRQMQDIDYIESTIGISSLPENLEDIARYRIDYPSATLKELGELLSPPVGKSGVNHRLNKISKIASEIRETRGGKDDD